MKTTVVVERRIRKRLKEPLLTSQLQRCVNLALKGPRGKGWSCKVGSLRTPSHDKAGDTWLYRVTVQLGTTSNRRSLEEKLPRILNRLAKAGCAGGLRLTPWVIVQPEGYSRIAEQARADGQRSDDRRQKADEPKALGAINLEENDHFIRIFGRHAQIRRIVDALKLAHQTDFSKRTHSLLDGPPGCGKSEIMKALSNMLGEEGQAWMWFDATSMTKAGAIEELMQASFVPPVLFIEEIEKCEESSLRWLLGVMDVRGQVRRTNYRVGNQARNVRMVVIASANDVRLLKQVMSGALYSRFQNKIYCPPPDRKVMQLILEREVKEMAGNDEWVEPTLRFAFDNWGMADPRDLITICTCGQIRLLDGAYQKDYEATMHPLERRDLLKRMKNRQKTSAKAGQLRRTTANRGDGVPLDIDGTAVH